MELTAKLVQLLPLQTGEGKNGQWKKQDIIVETSGQYPKKICISIWGDKVEESKLQIGNDLNISFDVESREYNGRWYTDVKAWKIDVAGGGAGPQGDMGHDQQTPPPVEEGELDDLPF